MFGHRTTQDVKGTETSDLQNSAADTYGVSIFVFLLFLDISESQRVREKRTMLCFYSQDCGAAVSSVIIPPVEGDNSSHLTEQSILPV